jgi:hypothetical protein
MSTPENNLRFDYIELSTPDPLAARAFCEQVFGWTFRAFGPDYQAWDDGRMTGGFTKGTPGTGVLVVMYAMDLEACRASVIAAGGTITKPIFEFPGGRRFEFKDPTGVPLAVWSQ